MLGGGVPVPALIDGPVLRVRSAGFARGRAVFLEFAELALHRGCLA